MEIGLRGITTCSSEKSMRLLRVAFVFKSICVIGYLVHNNLLTFFLQTKPDKIFWQKFLFYIWKVLCQSLSRTIAFKLYHGGIQLWDTTLFISVLRNKQQQWCLLDWYKQTSRSFNPANVPTQQCQRASETWRCNFRAKFLLLQSIRIQLMIWVLFTLICLFVLLKGFSLS